MKRIKQFLKRIRLVYCRSNTITRVVVFSAIALSLVALLTLHLTTQAAQRKTDALADQAAQLEQENGELQENIDGLGSADSVEKIAQDELGLVDPDTVIIDPEE